MKTSEIIDRWQELANDDLKTTQVLFDSDRYMPALFFLHLTIEKLLKGLIVKRTETHAPLWHDLVKLSEQTGIVFTEQQRDLMNEITTFNIAGRYDDYKYSLFKNATKEFAQDYLDKG